MKNTILIFITCLLFIGCINLSYIIYKQDRELKDYKYYNQGVLFIWNDDIESLPIDGSNIQIEMTEGNKVFLSPID